MITGYNTDIRHRLGVVHVQTEDKGLNNPVVESLLYVGGRVVASKRSGYKELLTDSPDEAELEERVILLMDRQHRTMMAAVQRGDFDSELSKAFGVAELPPVEPELLPEPVARTEAPAEDDQPDRSLDQVILDYLDSEAERQQLDLEMTFEVAPDQPAMGRIDFRATSASSKEPVPDVKIEVSLISTDRDPMVLGKGRTNDSGALGLNVALPKLSSGRAALIARASSRLGDAEIKQIL